MENSNINSFFNIDKPLLEKDALILEKCRKRFSEIDDITEYCQLKVLSAFINNGVSEAAMAGSTG